MAEKVKDWHEGIEPMRAIYARHCAGCCLHVLMDDGNIEQEFAVFSVETAKERGHADCLAAAELLVRMTPTQRGKLRKNRSLYS